MGGSLNCYKNIEKENEIQKEENDSNILTVLCTIEEGNNEQKEYCDLIKNSFTPKEDFEFKIKNGNKFSIKCLYKNQEIIVQEECEDDDKKNVNEIIEQLYNIIKD